MTRLPGAVAMSALAFGSGCGGDEVEAPAHIVDLVPDGRSSCVIDSRGRLRCWGAGGNGWLGYGESENIGDDEDWCEAGFVDIGMAVRSLEILGGNKCAISDAGEARCWGSGAVGFPFSTPEQTAGEGLLIRGPSPLVEIDRGIEHACVLLDTGAVRCWGAGAELGYGDSIDRGVGQDPNELLPELPDVPLGGEAVQIVAGGTVHGDHTCALLRSGGVRCWGTQTWLGYGTQEAIGDDETPEEVGDVPLGGAAIALTASGSNWCALLEDHSLRCWGKDAYTGILGYGDIFGDVEYVGDDETPMDMGPVPVGEPVQAVFMGGLRTCVLLDGGRVRCWGNSDGGEIGYGPLISTLYEPPDEDLEIGGKVVDLAVGFDHTCALLDSGRVRCWGDNYQGQLGLGDPTLERTVSTPIEVELLPECD
ncbi:hypothetical protein ENSA5_65070 [Enhygromyxa salina]|uniref:Regulator of chromosome condensation (RCC1) repeat protein n=1 Tax=Enhygromyxa salina TaxID=215803 RepID=A0A2S9XCA5_9BACT|nr:hypothetical protein [Enhygromyxa salina]PRP90488.1 hypothetical protein ENSA5_65070 [Enhygromyxa salina]